MQLLISLIGVVALIAIAWLLSEKRTAINWRTIIGAFVLQAGFAALVLYIPAGQHALQSVSKSVTGLLSFADQGINFLFGGLTPNFVFAFRVLPLIIFISALISMLYYLGIMQWVIRIIGGALQRILGISRSESIIATGNIFLSQGESPLLIRPFLSRMTRSELFTVMTCGMASVAGSVLGGYAAMGVEMKYLLAASFMAAPGSLMMAKLLIPEQGTPVAQDEVQMEKSEESNVIDAMAAGAMNGMKVAVAIGTMLLAFISVIAMVNHGLTAVGHWFGFEHVTMQSILGYIFAPIAYLIGVPAHEMAAAGSLIGQKLILNEFVAYQEFIPLKQILSAHTQVIITFALCGFANIGSIAIQLGSIGVLAPERRGEIASLGLRAVLAATLANLMSAALAGIFVGL
ncbi:nucleoside permease [Shewanella sp. NFH-SH190041]|uniref:NupC/NupG family nucleoside CNT transporter n=1 Tax=Shewanella sp. NFH-SH190041 TaxID=2950245 RepID=UPI0021C32D00|nr:NupC/NupG family nucleoside CNT transporter [Shewanella sp. NFH-SH190041]BDM65072.1 nucleoside permease [Shewanella sp. NFH-SH190041]